MTKVAIIGGGGCGLIATKALIAEGGFEVQGFDVRAGPGGLWNQEPSEPVKVPSLDPNAESLFSGAYPLLEANVNRDSFGFNDHAPPKEWPLYQTAEDILWYLKEYAADLNKYYKYNTKVHDVSKVDDKWKVTYSVANDATEHHEVFDKVVVATGNYSLPYIPEVPGLAEWKDKYPGSVWHSKQFRGPAAFADQTLLVVGAGVSAVELTMHGGFKATKVYRSIRNPETRATSRPLPKSEVVAGLVKLDPETKTAYFDDGKSVQVDTVVFATGYLRSYPFLKQLNTGKNAIITDGHKVNHLYEHIVYNADPSLAFIAVPMFIYPLPVAEVQSIWLAAVWASRIKLPSYEDMVQWENERIELKGDGKYFHQLATLECLAYSDFFGNEIAHAQPSNPSALVPRTIGERDVLIRKNTVALKIASIMFKAKTGKKAVSVEELMQAGIFNWAEE